MVDMADVKETPEVLVRSVSSLYEGAKTRCSVDTELSEEFKVEMWMHQEFVVTF